MGLAERFLAPSPKRAADKHLPPEETIRRVEDRLASCGRRVFRELRRVDRGRLGIPVFMSLYDSDGLAVTGRLKQMGKGSSEALARASALMELVERYSLFSHLHRRPFRWGTLGEGTMSPEELLASVEDPDDDREAREAAARALPRVKFHLQPALALPGEEEVLVPFFWFWLLYEFNGSAAGNTWAEAAVQATCELVERHVCALATEHGGPFRRVVWPGTGEEVRRLVDCFAQCGVRLFVRDFTFGFPVPTLGVLAYDPSTFPHRSEIVYTAGTATHPERAFVRALTEVAQLAGDFDTEGRYLESGLPKFETLEEARGLTESEGEVSLGALPDLSAPDHAEELRALAQGLEERGFRLYLLDVSDPELSLPATYVIMPGARFRERTRLSPLYQLVRTVALHSPRDEALGLLQELDREVPRYYVATYLGQLLAEEGAVEEAERAFRRALDLSPPAEDRPAIFGHLAHLALSRGDYRRAEAAAEEGLAQMELPELYNFLGTARFKQRKVPEALEAFLRAIELNPEGAVDYANVGACLCAMGLSEEAERFFESARALDPGLDLTPFRQAKA